MQKFENHSLTELEFALKDVSETLALHREKPLTDHYVAKLYTEFDFLTVRVMQVRKGREASIKEMAADLMFKMR